MRLGVGNSAVQSVTVISAALPRVISPLRGGYIRPSGGLCFAAVGGKVNVCRGSRHISINRTHSGSILLTITAVALPLQNVPPRAALLNILSQSDKIFHPRQRRGFHRAEGAISHGGSAAVFHCKAAFLHNAGRLLCFWGIYGKKSHITWYLCSADVHFANSSSVASTLWVPSTVRSSPAR